MQKTLLVLALGSEGRGGSYEWLQDVSRGLPLRGWRVLVALTDGATSAQAAAFPDSLRLSNRSGTSRGRKDSIRRMIRKTRADLVVPLMVPDSLSAVASCKLDGSPDVRLVYPAREVSAEMLADVSAYRDFVDGAGCVSRLLERLVVDAVGMPPDRTRHIPNGFDWASAPKAKQPREGGLRLGFAGRLDDDKRAGDLVGFVHELEQRGVDFSLDIAGTGSREAALRSDLAEAAAKGIVRFRGWIDRSELIQSYCESWDAILLFSPREGSPRSITEAMRYGVVPVVADFCGRREEGIVRHGETALVFPVGDVASAVDALCSASGRLAELSERATEEGGRIWSRAEMVSAWATFFEEICESPLRRGSLPRTIEPPTGRLNRWLGTPGAELVRRWCPPRRSSPWPYATFAFPRDAEMIEQSIRERCPGMTVGGSSSDAGDGTPEGLRPDYGGYPDA